MKKIYEEPEIRITDFEVADILATSGGPKDENIGEWDLFQPDAEKNERPPAAECL